MLRSSLWFTMRNLLKIHLGDVVLSREKKLIVCHDVFKVRFNSTLVSNKIYLKSDLNDDREDLLYKKEACEIR